MGDIKCVLLRVLFDVLSVIPIIAVAVTVHYLQPFHRGYFQNDESLMYPYMSSTVKSVVLFSVGPIVTIFIVTVTELVRAFQIGFGTKYRDIPLVVLCLYKFYFLFGFGYATTALFVQIGKIVIGRLRPHFFDVCRPTIINQTAYAYVYNFSCSGTDAKLLREMRLSFPSGHAAYSMFPAIFICLYLYYRMPRIAVASVLQAFIQTTVFSLAFYVGLSRVSDYKHHWSDVLAGMILGAAVAIFTVVFATDVNEFESFESYADEHELVSLAKSRQMASAS
uniref:Putative phosphatidate phosphatase n=1 Tax=Schistocephalus solidus TaxID=70667 RepID=A0A0V0J8R6_SCHSO